MEDKTNSQDAFFTGEDVGLLGDNSVKKTQIPINTEIENPVNTNEEGKLSLFAEFFTDNLL